MIAVLYSGLVMGTIHVWSGPDHLAAIAPLAARRPARAWIPGVRWGVGHSAGVALVGLLALWLRDLLPQALISSWGERLVGVMLIGIGLWALRKALRHHLHAHAHEHDGQKHVHVHVHGAKDHARAEAHRHTHAALGIGILHGLAGSSHFLGILPMLALRTTFDAGLYLAAFAGGTIASMAVFSTLVGTVAARCAISSDKAYRGLMGACAVAAVAVGLRWWILSWSGAELG